MSEPNFPVCPCQCVEACNAMNESHCMCPPVERALRGYISNGQSRPMSPEEREWCLQEIDNVEGHSRNDHANETDSDLARGVMSAWVDYCQDKGMM